MDGRTIKTSLGTTKYCSHFMKNQTCPKPDCMYLHDLGKYFIYSTLIRFLIIVFLTLLVPMSIYMDINSSAKESSVLIYGRGNDNQKMPTSVYTDNEKKQPYFLIYG